MILKIVKIKEKSEFKKNNTYIVVVKKGNDFDGIKATQTLEIKAENEFEATMFAMNDDIIRNFINPTKRSKLEEVFDLILNIRKLQINGLISRLKRMKEKENVKSMIEMIAKN